MSLVLTEPQCRQGSIKQRRKWIKQRPVALTFGVFLFPFPLTEDPQDFVALTQLPRAALDPAPLTAAGTLLVS